MAGTGTAALPPQRVLVINDDHGSVPVHVVGEIQTNTSRRPVEFTYTEVHIGGNAPNGAVDIVRLMADLAGHGADGFRIVATVEWGSMPYILLERS